MDDPAAQPPRSNKRQRREAAAGEDTSGSLAGGSGDELTSLLVAMGAGLSEGSDAAAAADSKASITQLAAAFDPVKLTTKLAEAAPQRHKAPSRHDSSSDSSSGDSSSSGEESDASGSASGTDSEGSGPWVTPHDPNRPKRPQSSFFIFSAAERKRAPSGTVMSTQVISAAWNAMTDLEKAPYEELSAKDTQRYKQAITCYAAPAKIQLSTRPTPEEERLYASELARYRARRERKRDRRRAIAQARRGERETARQEEREAQRAAREAEQIRQAQDVARLRQRNLGSATLGSNEAEPAEEQEASDAEEDADAENSSDEGVEPRSGGRRLRARNGGTDRAAAQHQPASSRSSKRKKLRSDSSRESGSDGDCDHLHPGPAQTLKEKSSGKTAPAKARKSSSTSPVPVPAAKNLGEGGVAAGGEDASWRTALDVWSPLLCQDVTMAWCKPTDVSPPP
jgi:hypothetical protein